MIGGKEIYFTKYKKGTKRCYIIPYLYEKSTNLAGLLRTELYLMRLLWPYDETFLIKCSKII